MFLNADGDVDCDNDDHGKADNDHLIMIVTVLFSIMIVGIIQIIISYIIFVAGLHLFDVLALCIFTCRDIALLSRVQA